MARIITSRNGMSNEWPLTLLDKDTNEILFPEKIVDISEESNLSKDNRIILSYYLVKKGTVVKITRTYGLDNFAGIHLCYPLTQGYVPYNSKDVVFETWAENCNLRTRELHDLIALYAPAIYVGRAKSRKGTKIKSKE